MFEISYLKGNLKTSQEKKTKKQNTSVHVFSIKYSEQFWKKKNIKTFI